MAKIKIHESARERFDACRKASEGMENSLEKCMERLSHWNPKDATITVFNDHCDDLSFVFRETYADGRDGIRGGIILHGRRDGFGSGTAPTFSVTIGPAEGYYIHT